MEDTYTKNRAVLSFVAGIGLGLLMASSAALAGTIKEYGGFFIILGLAFIVLGAGGTFYLAKK